VLRIGEELCHALEHAHERGVVHRDLKPGNVWLTEDGSARLGDFGLALSLDRSRITQEGMMVGTAAYMPPEQALSGEVSVRSDLYALGAVLYEMVTSRPPFLGDDVVAVISQHINTAPVAPSWHNPEIPRALEGLILRLLAKDPSQRPASAAAVRKELARAASIGAEVVPAEERAAANPLDRLAAGVFVGRDQELGHLRSAFDDSLSGRGRILMLVGEPGIGKTRTAEELATYARLRGAQVLWGRCCEGEGAPAYWPWVQIIRAYVHDREPGTLMSEMGPGAADIAEVVSEVRERLPGLPKPPELEPEQARFRLFDSITTFFKNASQGQPLALVVDDLHWADRPSLLLLQFLAKELAPSRLLLLGTYRDVELGRQHPLEQTLAELARSELSERVLLRGLGAADVARFIELSAGRTPPEALVEAVYRETEGNPFFVHEVVQLLQSDGRLESAEAVESWSLEIPQGVRQVVGRRLSSLSEECNRVLGIASVIGREFELPVLAEVSELAEDAVLELLEQAEGARIVGDLPAASRSYRFSHALIRETLYEEIRTTRRLRLHRRIAEATETLYAVKLEPRLAELAYHFCEAASGGDVTKAVDYAVRAAERETGLLAYEEAASQYERALTALEASEPVDESRRCELLLALGEAQSSSGTLPQFRETFRRALEIARQIGSPEQFARAALGLGAGMFSETPGIVDEALVSALEEALELLGTDESGLRARVMSRLASEIRWHEHSDPRESLCNEAIEMARRVDDRGALAWALVISNFVFRSYEDPARRLAIAEEIVELAQESGDKHAEFHGRSLRIVHLIALGDADGIDRESEIISGLADELRQPYPLGIAAGVRACRALWQGDLAEARRLSWEGRGLRLIVQGELANQVFNLQLYFLRRLQGRLAEALPALRAGISRFSANPIWRCLLACAHAETGNEGEARREFDELAEDDFSALRDDVNYLFDLGLLAEVCAALRDEKRAALLHGRLSSYKGRYLPATSIVTAGSFARSLALLAATMHRWDDAVRHIEEAIEVDKKMRAWGWLPRTQCDYARILLDRGGPGDRRKALDLLAEALETCQELGLKGWLDMCLELKLRAQGVDSGSVETSGGRGLARKQAPRPGTPRRPRRHRDADVQRHGGLHRHDRTPGRPRGARGDPGAQRHRPRRARRPRRLRGGAPGRRLPARLLEFARRAALRHRHPARLRRAQRAESRTDHPRARRPPPGRSLEGRGPVLRPDGDPRGAHRRAGRGRRDSRLVPFEGAHGEHRGSRLRRGARARWSGSSDALRELRTRESERPRVLRQLWRGTGAALPELRLREPAGVQVLWQVWRETRRRGSESTCAGSCDAPRARPPRLHPQTPRREDPPEQVRPGRRAQAGDGAVRGHQGLDGPPGAGRSRGVARDHEPLLRDPVRRGAPLRGNRQPVHWRRDHGALRCAHRA
jgi:tetratricopeptide (TPR) repeat protein